MKKVNYLLLTAAMALIARVDITAARASVATVELTPAVAMD